MKEKMSYFILAILLACANMVQAQSLDYAKSLIQQGRYLDAAKLLRPLADGGNAEAQYMASQLFFEGKGVDKNEAQCVKYATLAADQGYSDAVLFLARYYINNWSNIKTIPQKPFSVLSKYVNSNSGQQDSLAMVIQGEFYIYGQRMEKDEDKGWALIYEYYPRKYLNEIEEEFSKHAVGFIREKAKQAGKNSLEEYADYLYDQKIYSDYYKLDKYILKRVYGSDQVLKEKSDSGVPWAMSKWGSVLWNKERRYSAAMALWKKAMDAGSAYARSCYETNRPKAFFQDWYGGPKLSLGPITWKGNVLELIVYLTFTAPEGSFIPRLSVLETVQIKDAEGNFKTIHPHINLAGLEWWPAGKSYRLNAGKTAVLTISLEQEKTKGIIEEMIVTLRTVKGETDIKLRNIVWDPNE